MAQIAVSLYRLRLSLSAVRLLPHLALLRFGRDREALHTDIARWRAVLFDDGTDTRSEAAAFVRLMTSYPEFRNLFYYRTGVAGRAWSPLCRPLPTLYLNTPDIGPGLYLQHGFATIVSARRIGRDCWINQQVTIGYRNRDESPTLGDRVTVNAGAKIIGRLHVGDDAVIGANAVVVKDVPPRTTVVGVPARIVRRDGVRVDEPL